MLVHLNALDIDKRKKYENEKKKHDSNALKDYNSEIEANEENLIRSSAF